MSGKPGRPVGSTGLRVWRDGKYVSPRTLPTLERFMCYVEKSDECWTLEAVDHRTNVLRSPNSLPNVTAAKRTCAKGHPLDGVTKVKGRPRGKRYCMTCSRARSLARYHATKAA